MKKKKESKNQKFYLMSKHQKVLQACSKCVSMF